MREQGGSFSEKNGYSLSEPLMGRIISLSRAFQPYFRLEGQNLRAELVSPERGQLLISLMSCRLDSASQNRIVSEGDFSNAVIGDYTFPKSVQFANASFAGIDLKRANLNGANLSGAFLGGANLSGANLSEANLKGAVLSWADLKEADLSWANLNSTELSYVNLEWAQLKQADLTKSKLSGANLINARLNEAILNEADLSEARLNDASLLMAHLTLANLNGANLGGTDFRWADLRQASLKMTKNLTPLQLESTNSLFRCENLDPNLKTQLQKEKPCLFTKEGCN